MKVFFTVIFMVIVFAACKKEHDQAQWDVDVLGPVAHATMDLHDLISDSVLYADPSGLLQIHYDTTFSAITLDSVYQINDTTIPTTVLFFPFQATLQPNTSFFTNNNNVTLALGGVEIKDAVIKSGFIRISIKNTLHSKIKFVYTIPKALKNGAPFSVTAFVDSASTTDPKYFIHDYDFSGYSIDMTGSNGTRVNTLAYNVQSTTDSAGVAFSVNALDTTVNLQTSLIGITPSYVRGYLGQQNINLSKDEATGLASIIRGGMIALDSVKMQLDIINGIGADGQAYFTSFKSINTNSGTTVDLVAPSLLNRYININRANKTGVASDPVIPFVRSFYFDNSNSNITTFFQNLPYRFSYDLNMSLNPLGNISGSNDFVYSDHLISTRVQAWMPLRLGANQLALADTFTFTMLNASDYDNIHPFYLTLIADNGFPFDMLTQLYMIDGNNNTLDTLLVPELIHAATVDANYVVTSDTQTKIKIPIDDARKNRLLKAVKIGVRSKLTTSSYPQVIPLYEKYKLNLRLVADGTYSIR